MEHAELLRLLADVFERLSLPYIVTGSTATIVYGDPRFTNDIDVVVRLPSDKIEPLIAAFSPDEFYLSRAAIEGAVASRGQFNILHPRSGLKADVMIASQSSFDQSRFRRLRMVAVQSDRQVCFASPEDVILKKLIYFREGGSEKHLRNIAGVLKVQGENVDRTYLADWVNRLSVEQEWQILLEYIASSGTAANE